MKCTKKMRYLVLVLLVCWLWNATSSKADDCISSFQCRRQSHADVDFMCEQEHTVSISAKCGENSDGISMCNISIMNMPFCDQYYSTSMPTTDKPTMPEECKCTPVSENSESEATSVVTNTGHSTSNSSNLAIALGALAGLLLVLLVIISTVLAWTCWLLKRRGGMKFNTEYELRSSTDHGQLVNPTYEGDDLLHLQPSGSVPAYETIPPHPRDGARLEVIQQDENGYHVLSRELRANPETTTTTRMEMILEESRGESYSKLKLKEETGSTKKTSNEEYSRLERSNIGSTVTKDTCLDNDTTADSNYDSSEETERKERVMDDKAFDDNGDALQLEFGDVEKGQQEEAKGKPPLITTMLDEKNERNDSNNTSSTDSA